MDKFNVIGKNDLNELKKLADLPRNKKFLIVGFKVLETKKFGKQVLLNLENFDTFLPSRFAKFPEEELDELVGRKLIYKGKNGKSNWVCFE